MVQPISVVRQHIVKALDLNIQIDGTEAKVENPAVRLSVRVDELAEVSIKGDQYPPVPDRDGQNLGVFERRLVVSGHERNIVPPTAQVWRDAGIRAFIDQESLGRVTVHWQGYARGADEIFSPASRAERRRCRP
jgi:hypothetical protein